MRTKRLKCKSVSDQLDSCDWNKESYVTGVQLVEMRPSLRKWFEAQPNVWRPLDFRLDVLHNCAHPDNDALLVRALLAEAVHV